MPCYVLWPANNNAYPIGKTDNPLIVSGFCYIPVEITELHVAGRSSAIDQNIMQ